jgi:hypothetical protein
MEQPEEPVEQREELMKEPEQPVEQPEERTEQVEERPGTLHHHRIQHHLTTENPEEDECQDNNGKFKNWNSPNLL